MFVNVWETKLEDCRECGYLVAIDASCENCANNNKETN